MEGWIFFQWPQWGGGRSVEQMLNRNGGYEKNRDSLKDGWGDRHPPHTINTKQLRFLVVNLMATTYPI